MDDLVVSQDALDELYALRAIYDDDLQVEIVMGMCSGEWRAGRQTLQFTFFLPKTYPESDAPVMNLNSSTVDRGTLDSWEEELLDTFHDGEPILFDWIETLKRKLEILSDALDDTDDGSSVSSGRSHDTEAVSQDDSDRETGHVRSVEESGTCAIDVIHGQPFTEKKSTFQAHLSHVTSMDEVQAFVDSLLSISKIQNATHNIMAYRYELENGSIAQDCDDDGESAAGGRLLHLLQIADARNVCVVVSRWYGGILLGPARFTHINNAARQLLEAEGYIKGASNGASKGGRGSKKR